MGRRAELRELTDQQVRDWMAPRRAAWQVAVENVGIDGAVGAIVRAHNAFAGGGMQLVGGAGYNKRAAVGTHQHEPIRTVDAVEGELVVGVGADPALPPLPDALWPAATYAFAHDGVGPSPALAARCDVRFGPPPGWGAATSPAMLAHLVLWRLRRGGVCPDPPQGWMAAHTGAVPAWQADWSALTRAQRRARLPFDWWVERFAWEVRRDWWLCLPDAQTPLNAVALARNALAAGAAGIITADEPGPGRAPLGKHWRVEPWANVVAWARAEGRALVALEQGGRVLGAPGSPTGARCARMTSTTGNGPRATPVPPLPSLPPRAVLVAGHEVRGLSPAQLRACDEVVALPQWGSVSSLNVASAAGLVLDLAPATRSPP